MKNAGFITSDQLVLLRESGYMLPQGAPARAFLQGMMITKQPEGFPVEAVRQLLEMPG